MGANRKSPLVLGVRKINKVLFFNFIILLIPSVCFYVWGDGWNAAYSCMLGGLVYLVCQYFFALIFFSKGGAQQANQIIKRLFLGEGLKLILTLFSLASIFYYQLAQPLPLLLGFILMIMVGWLLPWVLKV